MKNVARAVMHNIARGAFATRRKARGERDAFT